MLPCEQNMVGRGLFQNEWGFIMHGVRIWVPKSTANQATSLDGALVPVLLHAGSIVQRGLKSSTGEGVL